ncbi:MAG: GFA family protein [Actinomycetota bacterium]|nr:GFA family protein [Actinomycetota bacterium]
MEDTTLPLTGGCMCGAVRYEVDAPLELAGYCHCTRCQRRTGGSASISARVQPGSFRIARGEEAVEIFRPDQGFTKAFCSGCGSALYSQSQDDPEILSVRMGTFDTDPGIRPSYRQFVSYAAGWEPLPDDGLPRFPERRIP